MTEKADGLPTDVTVIKVEENGKIAELWPHVQAACLTFFNGKLTEIGNEMKQV